MANAELTIKQAIETGHITLPHNEALILLQFATKKQKEYLLAHSEEVLTDQARHLYHTYIHRRDQGEPIAYITGEKEFWSLTFKVTPGILIPRPDTELLVETSLKTIQNNPDVKILELGTGSGCIALALANEQPDANIIATDISATCINIAEENAKQLEIDNVTFIRSHWFSEISDTQFDLIVSNPPYIAENDEDLESSVENFEPDIALLADNNGLADLYHIIENSHHHLNKNGTLILEHGYTQGEAVRGHMIEHEYSDIQTLKDIQGHERITLGKVKI